jgi:hypothetical protein
MGRSKMKRYGIIVMEITENDPDEKRIFRKHKEEEIFRSVLAEENFNFRGIHKAILEGVNHAEKKS